MDDTGTQDPEWHWLSSRSRYGIGAPPCSDIAVLSAMCPCQQCAYASAQYGGKDTEAFKTWFQTHEPECNQNYHVSAGGMEVSAARADVVSFNGTRLPLHHHGGLPYWEWGLSSHCT